MLNFCKGCLFFFFTFGLLLTIKGQQPGIQQPKDSLAVYRRIETFSNRRNFTRLIYPILFRPAILKDTLQSVKTIPAVIQPSFAPYEGKTIRNIVIATIDPFRTDFGSDRSKLVYFLGNTGNKLHVKTMPLAVKNYLLFKRNDSFDSLVVRESERLVRQQRFVHSVSIHPVLVGKDSVDLFIDERDVWSLIPDGSLSNTHAVFKLTEQNFLGTGQQFQQALHWNYTTGRSAYEAGYDLPNIDNTYINTSLYYSIGENKSSIKRLNIERPFYSVFTRWAGGALVEQKLQTDSIPISGTLHSFGNFKLSTQDYWAGSAWQLFKGRTESERTINLIASARILRIHYVNKPQESIDPYHALANETFYLASLGINSRKYVQDRYLFRYGLIEDIPIGRTYALMGGYQIKDENKQWYTGIKFSWADYYGFGYLSVNLEYETFYDADDFSHGIIKNDMIYFTRLVETGNWKFRQFVKSQIIIGIHPQPTDNLTINDDLGISGFNSSTLTGKHKILVTFQTQSYAPWHILGFRFGPYMVCSLAMLGNDPGGFRQSRLYSQFGVGLLIKNDHINYNYFQLSLAFYPTIPGIGNNVFKTNAFSTSDFRLRDFEIGKPEIIGYH